MNKNIDLMLWYMSFILVIVIFPRNISMKVNFFVEWNRTIELFLNGLTNYDLIFVLYVNGSQDGLDSALDLEDESAIRYYFFLTGANVWVRKRVSGPIIFYL